MRINEISVHNFRGFEDLSVKLHKRITVFVGSNGAGKSSLLEAISISAGIFLYGFDGASRSSIKKTDARNVCHEMGSVLDLQPQFPVSIKAIGIISDQPVEWECSLNSEKSRTSVGNAKQLTSIASNYQKSVRTGDRSVILPIISYYGTGRLWAQKRAKKNENLRKFNRINGYVDCLESESNEKLMLNWFQKMTLQEVIDTGNPIPEFVAVKSAISKCYNNINGCSDSRVVFNLDTHEIDVIYTNENGVKMRMPMSDLSDGYKNTISMIADIAYRMALLNPQLLDDVLTTPGVVMIDEVDLHLHPVWQQRIIGDLLDIFPNVQFVVSTHAPTVINSIDKENLVILKDNQALIAPQQVYGRDTNSIMREIMNTSERPLVVKEQFSEFYSALDDNELKKAKDILDNLIAEIGQNDPEITSCIVSLELENI